MSNANQTIWYRTPSGACARETGYPAPVVPEGAVEITEAEYLAAVDAVKAAHEATAAAEQQAREAAQAQGADALSRLLPGASPEDLQAIAAYLAGLSAAPVAN